MRHVLLYDHAELPEAERSAIELVIQSLRTVGEVLAWTRARVPALEVLDIVTQDEYSHDVVLAIAGQRFLAFDTT